jgi:hypothetical protein
MIILAALRHGWFELLVLVKFACVIGVIVHFFGR